MEINIVKDNIDKEVINFKKVVNEIIPKNNKTLYENNLLNFLTNAQWIKLIKIWKNSTSLLRSNNLKQELNKIENFNKNYTDFLQLCLQYYIDLETHTNYVSLNLPKHVLYK